MASPIQQLNEAIEFSLLENATMLATPLRYFRNFYNYGLAKPKLNQKLYFIPSNISIRIPTDTINHTWKEHKTTAEQWLDILTNIKNIQNACLAKRRFNGLPIYLCRVSTNHHDYGIALTECPKYFYIQTAFEDDKNSIDNWIKNGSVTQPTNHPSASFAKSTVVSSRFTDSIDIIAHLLKKIEA